VLAVVPTGWVADKLGRRVSMLTGIFFQALSAVLFIFGQGFWHFWLAIAVCGLGDTFRSGAEEALLYDSCLATRQRARYRPLLASAMFFATIVMVIGQIAGGIIATYISWELPFWLEVGFSSAGFLLVLAMLEPPRTAEAPEDEPPKAKADGRRARRYHTLALAWLPLIPVACFATLIEAVPQLAHFHLPAELSTGLGFTPMHLGFMYAGFELIQGLGNKLAGHQRLKRPTRVLPWIGGAMLLCFALFGARSWLTAGDGAGPVLLALGLGLYLLARAGMDFLFGLAAPLISEETNRRTSSAVRATALSVVNAARRLVPLSLLPLSAALTVGQGYPAMYALLLAALIAPVMLSAWWLRRSEPPAAAAVPTDTAG